MQLIDLFGRIVYQRSMEIYQKEWNQIDFRAGQSINPGVYINRVNTYDKLENILVQK